MSLKFAGKTVRCGDRHGDLIDVSRDVHIDETWYWGGLGLSEIRGGLGGSDMSCIAWIYDANKYGTVAKYKKFWTYIDELRGDKWLLKNGTIICKNTISGTTIKRKVPDCTLRSVELVRAPQQDEPKPINATGQGDWQSWVMPVRFVWRRLT